MVDEMTDSDLWREYRRAQQQRRAERLPKRTDEILALRGKGYDVRQLSDYQFRVDGALDFYPIHRRYHHITTGKRGDYKNPLSTAIRLLKGGRA